MSQITEQAVLDSLSQIIDPDLKKDIVTLGFVRDLKIDGRDVSFRIVLTTPPCPVNEEMEGMARDVANRYSTAPEFAGALAAAARGEGGSVFGRLFGR